MNIMALFKLVPDLVEELEIDPGGKSLDMTWTRLIINELDDHAVEQAILLKEASGAVVTVIAPDADGADDVLFTASAKGADRLIKLVGDFEGGLNNHALARAVAQAIGSLQPDLILTGVQAHNDMDGAVGPLLAEILGLPYVGYVSGVKPADGKVLVHKEYPGGLIAEMELTLPAVLGIQASEEPPRYVAVSKVRQSMKTATIDEFEVSDPNPRGEVSINRMYQPEVGERATMLKGDEDEIADQLVDIFKEMGII